MRADATGERHNRLVAVRFAETKNGQPRWLFKCDCGTEKEASIGAVRSGAIKSCGCLVGDANRARLLKHGHRSTPTYLSWQNAKGRCFNPRNKRFPDYGGRGITMCDRWRDSFEAFLEDMGERPNGRSIDRIDNDGNYEPGNCRWATKGQQNGNVRGRLRIEHGGETYSLKEFSVLMDVSFANLSYRVKKAGHDPLKAVETLRKGKWRRIIARQSVCRPTGISRVPGISWMSRLGKWRVYMYVDHKQIHVGTFAVFEDAVGALRRAKRE